MLLGEKTKSTLNIQKLSGQPPFHPSLNRGYSLKSFYQPKCVAFTEGNEFNTNMRSSRPQTRASIKEIMFKTVDNEVSADKFKQKYPKLQPSAQRLDTRSLAPQPIKTRGFNSSQLEGDSNTTTSFTLFKKNRESPNPIQMQTINNFKLLFDQHKKPGPSPVRTITTIGEERAKISVVNIKRNEKSLPKIDQNVESVHQVEPTFKVNPSPKQSPADKLKNKLNLMMSKTPLPFVIGKPLEFSETHTKQIRISKYDSNITSVRPTTRDNSNEKTVINTSGFRVVTINPKLLNESTSRRKIDLSSPLKIKENTVKSPVHTSLTFTMDRHRDTDRKSVV